ncbi:glycine C-acetyltransferase [Dehalococcoidia bacterium]|nr:glycine C-acetyltransferase [Dehalococcoidia bacterium]
MQSRFDFVLDELQQLKDSGLYNLIRTIESAQGAWIVVDGSRVLNLCSNNYLGLANEPRLKEAAIQAIEQFGVGPGAVRSIAGTTSLHLKLEKALADFKGVEDALSFQSGLCANIGTIATLVGEGDAIFSDELNHASIIDGARLTRAKRFIYPHRDAKGLREVLDKEGKSARRKLIITDGVFSMDGDLAPLPELVEVAEEYEALIMVDDAHGEGVLGDHGRGIVDHFGLQNRVDIEMGTMSKAFGVVGGYIAGKKVLTEYLRQRARTHLFSSAVTPPDVAACIVAVNLLASSDELVQQLWENTGYFKKGMKSLGFDLAHSETPITPVMLGDAKLARSFSQRLFEEGIFAQAIGYPTVAMDKARIRVMISAAHSHKDLDFALGVFGRVGEELGVL